MDPLHQIKLTKPNVLSNIVKRWVPPVCLIGFHAAAGWFLWGYSNGDPNCKTIMLKAYDIKSKIALYLNGSIFPS